MASRTMINEVHFINLERDKERLIKFRELNDHVPAVRHPAVNGANLDRERLRNAGYITQDLSYGSGSLGNALSHIQLWQHAIEKKAAVTIAEDDAVFVKSFLGTADLFLRSLPDDWDVVLWGWNFDSYLWVEMPEGVARCKMEFMQDDLRQNIETFRAANSHPTPIRLRHSFGILGYTVSLIGAQKLLKTCLPLRNVLIPFPGFDVVIENETIDCMMNMAYPEMKAYVCVPPLAASENRHEGSNIRDVP